MIIQQEYLGKKNRQNPIEEQKEERYLSVDDKAIE